MVRLLNIETKKVDRSILDLSRDSPRGTTFLDSC